VFVSMCIHSVLIIITNLWAGLRDTKTTSRHDGESALQHHCLLLRMSQDKNQSFPLITGMPEISEINKHCSTGKANGGVGVVDSSFFVPARLFLDESLISVRVFNYTLPPVSARDRY
jgi:hypothetical protein